jgi:hypothetical protein
MIDWSKTIYSTPRGNKIFLTNNISDLTKEEIDIFKQIYKNFNG